MPTSAVKSSVPRLSATTRGWTSRLPRCGRSRRRFPPARRTSRSRRAGRVPLPVPRRFRRPPSTCSGLSTLVSISAATPGITAASRSRTSNRHGPVHPHQHVGALARHLRDRIGDQCAGAILLRRRHRVLQVEDDAVAPRSAPVRTNFSAVPGRTAGNARRSRRALLLEFHPCHCGSVATRNLRQ